jgi:hypothetical protein
MNRRILGAGLGLPLLVLLASAQAEEKARENKKPAVKAARASKNDLTPESFPKLHALVRPHENEWRHLRVQWLTDVVAARKKAAAEDKPIVICYTGGAGYNEPLGVC